MGCTSSLPLVPHVAQDLNTAQGAEQQIAIRANVPLSLEAKRRTRQQLPQDLCQDPRQFHAMYSEELELLAPAQKGKKLPVKCLICRRVRKGDVVFDQVDARKTKYLWQHVLSAGHINAQEALARAPVWLDCRGFSLQNCSRSRYALSAMPEAVRLYLESQRVPGYFGGQLLFTLEWLLA